MRRVSSMALWCVLLFSFRSNALLTSRPVQIADVTSTFALVRPISSLCSLQDRPTNRPFFLPALPRPSSRFSASASHARPSPRPPSPPRQPSPPPFRALSLPLYRALLLSSSSSRGGQQIRLNRRRPHRFLHAYIRYPLGREVCHLCVGAAGVGEHLVGFGRGREGGEGLGGGGEV